MARTTDRRPGRGLVRALLTLAVLAGVLGMHGLGPVSMPDSGAAHAAAMRSAAIGPVAPALMSVGEQMMCSQHPCLAVLRGHSTPSSALARATTTPPDGMPPAWTAAVSATPRAPPPEVSLTRLCVCRT